MTHQNQLETDFQWSLEASSGLQWLIILPNCCVSRMLSCLFFFRNVTAPSFKKIRRTCCFMSKTGWMNDHFFPISLVKPQTRPRVTTRNMKTMSGDFVSYSENTDRNNLNAIFCIEYLCKRKLSQML